MVQLVKLDGFLYMPKSGEMKVLFHIDRLTQNQRELVCRDIISPSYRSDEVHFNEHYMISCGFPNIPDIWDQFKVSLNLMSEIDIMEFVYAY